MRGKGGGARWVCLCQYLPVHSGSPILLFPQRVSHVWHSSNDEKHSSALVEMICPFSWKKNRKRKLNVLYFALCLAMGSTGKIKDRYSSESRVMLWTEH